MYPRGRLFLLSGASVLLAYCFVTRTKPDLEKASAFFIIHKVT
jgi:hypothetical protein